MELKKKLRENKGDSDTNCTVTKGFVKGLEELEIKAWVETVQTTELRSVGLITVIIIFSLARCPILIKMIRFY